MVEKELGKCIGGIGLVEGGGNLRKFGEQSPNYLTFLNYYVFSVWIL